VAGRSRNVVGGARVDARANLSTARFSIEHEEPLFEPLAKKTDFGDGWFEIRGNIASVSVTCESEATLEGLLETLTFVFPAVLGRRIPDVPYATHAWGLLNDTPFRVEYEPTGVAASTTVTSKRHQEDLAVESWSHAVSVASIPRLKAGCQYFHTACRLLEAGQNRFEFTAEAILNFAKCLQAFCGDTRDDARRRLRELDYGSVDLDARFIPAMVLRDQFDVAHIALSRLTRPQLRVLHEYADLAEPAFRDLMNRVLTQVAAGRYAPPETELGTVSGDKQKILRRLEAQLASIGSE
jgi:hypothetical protein